MDRHVLGALLAMHTSTALRRSLALALALALAACETVPPAGDDGGPTPDAGPEQCVIDRECSDDDWCNGDEICMPGATDADEDGCIAAPEPRCADGYECDAGARECVTICEVALDADGDGRRAEACGGDDCDDADPNRYPGNVEVCDGEGHDEDCNDETFGFLDADGDGSASRVCCNGPVCGDDCNDGDSSVNPRIGDVCDGIDNDCSGAADEGCPCGPGDTRPCGSDAALASTGICRPGTQVCVMGVFTGGCVGAIEPGEEICDGLARDEDCDGDVDEAVLRTYYRDADGDGYGIASETLEACSAPDGWASNSFDCDDSVAPVNPGIPEICNGRDDDCDTMIDEGLLRPYYADGDGDGFGATATLASACTPPTPAHVERGGDCDDTRASVSPVGIEGCNARDDDCDGSTDEGVLRSYYRDQDGDGVGGTTTMTGCAPPAGYVALGGDCADMDAARFPGRYDACNGVDDDCNGTIDPGCTCTDGATQGCGPASSVGRCVRGTQVCVGGRWGDCGGAVSATTESCNGIDDDCDGTTDETTTVTTCRGDGDGDGYGAGATSTQCRDATRPAAGYCPPGFTTTIGDCNDSNGAVRPMAAESCNGTDDDCDTTIDEGVTVTGCYADADADTYGVGGATMQCRDAARMSAGYCPVGYVDRGGDCNDAASAVRPGAAETCNGRDDSCSGTADDGPGMICALGTTRAGTGAYGTCGSVAGSYACQACTSEIFTPSPPAETCDGLDNDCDGARDEAFACERSTTGHACVTGCGTVGTRSCSTSCSFMGQTCAGTEVCNGCDDDADGTRDEGFGPGGSTVCYLGQTQSCTRMCGTTAVAGTQRCLADCSGWSACTATELCNGCDDDGDGSVDNGFFCPQNQLTYCTTACGTPGQRVCNGTCSAHTYADCRALSESCNFCDDDGDFDEVAAGTTIDPEDEAVSSDVLHAGTACADWTLAGSATCSGSVITVTNGPSDVGAMWAPPVYFGWGPIVVQASVGTRDLAPGVPGEGFSILVTDVAPGALVGTTTHNGAPIRHGLLLVWRYNGSGDDTISVGELSSLFAVRSSHTITSTSPIAGYRVSPGSGLNLFTLELRYEATPLTGSRGRIEVTLIESSGNRITVPMSATDLGTGADILTAGERVWTGFTAATSSTNDAETTFWLTPYVFAANPPTNVSVEETCTVFATP